MNTLWCVCACLCVCENTFCLLLFFVVLHRPIKCNFISLKNIENHNGLKPFGNYYFRLWSPYNS